jgi:beta-N-acetylhexosaminidase
VAGLRQLGALRGGTVACVSLVLTYWTLSAIAAVAGSSPDRPPAAAPVTTDPARAERSRAPGPSRAQQRARAAARLAGRVVVVTLRSPAPPGALLRAVKHGAVAGVLLDGASIETRAQVHETTAALQRAAQAGGRPPLLVLAEQEGGARRAFGSIGPRRAPAAIADDDDAFATAREEGADAGSQLRELGVNVDLAPSLDLPGMPGAGPASASWGRTSEDVADLACEFANGLRAGGVVPALKHLPASGTATEDALEPYRRCLASGAALVVLAPGPAAVEREVRERVGFDGVVLDLSPARAGDAPSRLRRGVDLVVVESDAGEAGRARRAIAAAVGAGRVRIGALRRAGERVGRLREGVS